MHRCDRAEHRYLAALDTLGPLPPPANPKPRQRSEPLFWQPANPDRTRRAENLAAWHLMLIDRLMGSDAEDRLDRLASHPALDGPEHTFLRARLAHRHGALDTARTLVADAALV
ncbi:hypothetical protein GCM10023176_35030 [Micromonospora coerulea]|uniref:Transcriptional regulator n=1 Tax=Micromonospora coerulea TaxID=47856 RepID=A0ABP8SRC3_9ACTN